MRYCSTCGYPAPCGRCEDSDNPSARISVPDTVDVYHPLVANDHDSECAALCTNWNDAAQDFTGCDNVRGHHCWCPDGSLSYAAFQTKHPDVTVAEAE
jgi:hypothetical protein